MAFIHGKGTVVTLATKDLSAYSNSIEFSREADSHEVTTFGKVAKVYNGGLTDGTATLEGIYDGVAVNGPRAVIEPLLGTVVTLIYKPEGTGTGKPMDTVSVVVTSYSETAPVADMITWSCEMQMSDDVATTAQV